MRGFARSFVAFLAFYVSTVELSAQEAPVEKVAPVKVVLWTDPLQKAFSCEVPAGWAAQGGMIHRSAVEPRGALDVVSPDKKTIVRLWDASLPTFAIPMPPYFPEGSTYSPGYGVVMRVRAYVQGLQFAKEYLSTTIGLLGGGNPAVVWARPRADIASKLDALCPSAPGVVQFVNTCGELEMSFVLNGEPYSGYCFCTTRFSGSRQVGNWEANQLFLHLSPSSGKKSAHMIMEHMVASLRVDPAWFARNLQNGRQVAEIVNKSNSETVAIMDGVRRNRERVQDATHQAWDDYIRGQDRWTDGAGNTYIAPNDYEKFYKTAGGEVLGAPKSISGRDLQPLDLRRLPISERH